jgi:mono/diheme cytochrome c family protein
VSVIDTAADAVVGELPVGTDLTSTVVRSGRGFLYDAKLSGNGTGSCASCHVDGDTDHLAWDLGNPGGEMSSFEQNGRIFEFHPMKGPMTTQTLRGLAGTGPLHWRGDKADFLAFNPAFEGLMGGSQLSSADMLLYAAFADTILFHPNPNQNLDRSLPASLGPGNPIQGRDVFLTIPGTFPGATCNACHTANPGPGTNGFLNHPSFRTQALKVPHLRNIYQKLLFNLHGRTIDGFGLDHDGRVADFPQFLGGTGFSGYTAQQKLDLEAYMMSFDTGTAPAVGHTITFSAANIDSVQMQARWATLEQQAVARHIDVVVNGTIAGRVRRLSYRPASNDYAFDSLPTVSLTRAQLQALIERGDTLNVMGVPPRDAVAATPLASLARAATAGQRVMKGGH